MEAILFWCEKNSIEQETITPFIKKDPILKARLLEFAVNKNFIKKDKE
jgi:hypothetical protein